MISIAGSGERCAATKGTWALADTAVWGWLRQMSVSCAGLAGLMIVEAPSGIGFTVGAAANPGLTTMAMSAAQPVLSRLIQQRLFG